MRLFVWGRRSGKRALLEWAMDTWSDFASRGVTSLVPGLRYPVCPTCLYRYRVAYAEYMMAFTHYQGATVVTEWHSLTDRNRRKSHVLIATAPPVKGPFYPEGPNKAEGCRCWKGLSDNEAAELVRNTCFEDEMEGGS